MREFPLPFAKYFWGHNEVLQTIWVLGICQGSLGAHRCHTGPFPLCSVSRGSRVDKYAKHDLIKHTMCWLIKWLLRVKRKPC